MTIATDLITSRPLIEAAAKLISEKLTAATGAAGPSGWGGGSPGGSDGPQDPIAALATLEIEPDLVTALTPLFAQVGLKLTPDEIYSSLVKKRKLLVAKDGSSSLYVISVHKCVIGMWTDQTFAAFSMLEYLFNKNSRLRIISRDLDAMDLGFPSILEQWQDNRGIEAIFIPWRWIARLLREQDDQQKFLSFKEAFRLEASSTKTETEQPTAITDNEREQILKILSDYAGRGFLKPQDAMQKLVLAADFPDPKKFEATWKEDIEWNSLHLFNYAKGASFPSNHSRSGQSTLGWLLKALRDQAIDENSKKALVEIIMGHKLIADSDVIAKLKEQTSA